MPDGTVRRQKLPDARRVRVGGKVSLMIECQGHLFIFWMKRVKGGWRLMDDAQDSSTASVPSSEAAKVDAGRKAAE